MLRHKKPFKSAFDIGQFELKKKKLEEKKHSTRSIRDDGGNKRLFEYEESSGNGTRKDNETDAG